jgi:hypothetical protein
MSFVRGCGSWAIVSSLLVLLFAGAIHSASIPAPRCIAKFNSTLKITEIPDGGPVNDTVPKVGRIRRSSVGDSGIESSEPSVGEASIDFHDYVDDGIPMARWLKSSDEEVTADLVASGHFQQGDHLASRFADFESLRDSGWNMRDQTSDLANNFNAFAAFGTALKSLRISDKARPAGKLEATIYEHTLQWMDGTQSREVSRRLEGCGKTSNILTNSSIAYWRSGAIRFRHRPGTRVPYHHHGLLDRALDR